MRLSRSDYYGLVQSLKCRVFSSIYIKIVPSFKLLKGEFKLAAYPSQCFIQGSISISLTYTHTRTTMQFRKANSWTQTCLGLPNESEPLPWRALSEMHVVGGSSVAYGVMFSQCTLRAGEENTQPKVINIKAAQLVSSRLY